MDKDYLQRLAKEYLNTKEMSNKVDSRLDEIKKTLTNVLDERGVPDEKGNLWVPAGDVQLKKERRSSVSFDEDAAKQWAIEQGIFNDVKRVIIKEVLDVDLLLAYAWEHREVAEAIEGFSKEKVTWAFKVVEKKSYDDEP